MNNPTFNCAEFDIIKSHKKNPFFICANLKKIKSQAGLNSYRLSAKEWMQKTNAIGIVAKAGRYEGTYAHKDIVFEIDLLVEHGEPLSNDTANKEDIGELSSRGL